MQYIESLKRGLKELLMERNELHRPTRHHLETLYLVNVKVKETLSSEQERVPCCKSIVAPIEKRVGGPSTLRKEILSPSANGIE